MRIDQPRHQRPAAHVDYGRVAAVQGRLGDRQDSVALAENFVRALEFGESIEHEVRIDEERLTQIVPLFFPSLEFGRSRNRCRKVEAETLDPARQTSRAQVISARLVVRCPGVYRIMYTPGTVRLEAVRFAITAGNSFATIGTVGSCKVLLGEIADA